MDWSELSAWLSPAAAASIAIIVALVVHRIGRAIIFRVTAFSALLHSVAVRINRPAQWLLPLIALQGVWQGSPNDLPAIDTVRHLNGLLLIATLTWLLIQAVRGVADGVISRHRVDVADNLAARRIHTQTRVLARTAMTLIGVIGLAFMLMTFPGARQLGTSLLASAGVIGIVAGIAAQSVFSNLIAGLQIALTQPIRLDDVLIVQGEWGRVEEITGTYVVLRIWDERRLIIPLRWFIENPFENWTRRSADILGTVFLWVDYRLPLEPLRAEAQRVCEASSKWDGKVCGVIVFEAGPQSMQLRVLVSAASSGDAWDLRCEMREALVNFIAREHPECLPRLRAEVDALPAPEPAATPA
jgi:small-conductance mechanosensitive channel